MVVAGSLDHQRPGSESQFDNVKLVLSALETMLGSLNPNLGKIWTNPNIGLKM